jgi:hypothetical protein
LGGYGVLGTGVSLSTNYALKPHYQVRTLASIFWIGDGVTKPTYNIQIIYTNGDDFTQSISETITIATYNQYDVCSAGIPFWPKNVDITTTFTPTNLQVQYQTDAGSNLVNYYWGIR